MLEKMLVACLRTLFMQRKHTDACIPLPLQKEPGRIRLFNEKKLERIVKFKLNKKVQLLIEVS